MDGLSLASHAIVREFSTWIELDRIALLQNLNALKKVTLPSAGFLAVVKANAYGHGLREIAHCIEHDVSFMGVATVDEAFALRRYEISTPILLFGIPTHSEIEVAIHAGISLSVSSFDEACRISEIARRMNQQAAVHVKIDTGMGRLGIVAREALSQLAQIATLEALHLEGIYTHFAQGEEEGDSFTRSQIQIFQSILAACDKKGIHFPYRHAANSVGISNYRDAHFNLVRPGLTLYGLYPSDQLKKKVALTPVLSWKARVILIKKLQAGESTGYSRLFQAKEDTHVAILPVGYGHGYPFALSNKGHVLIKGKKYPIAGRVSMDYIAIHIGRHTDGIEVNDIVTLIGQDSNESISGEDLARTAGTIPYEILTRLDTLIPRVFK